MHRSRDLFFFIDRFSCKLSKCTHVTATTLHASLYVYVKLLDAFSDLALQAFGLLSHPGFHKVLWYMITRGENIALCARDLWPLPASTDENPVTCNGA